MAFWSARTELGRCSIQAFPCSSIETLETWPHTHLLGNFAQDGSTSNFGVSRASVRKGCANARCPSTMATAAAITARTARAVTIIWHLSARKAPGLHYGT